MDTHATAPPPTPQRPSGAAAAAPRGRSWPRRLGLGLAATLAGVVALAALALGLLWHAEFALPWVLGRVPGVHASGVSGSLGSGRLRIERLEVALPDDGGRLQVEQLAIDGLRAGWRPHAGAWLSVAIDALRARSITFAGGPAPAQPAEPPAAPQSLRLPLSLGIDTLSVDRVQVDRQPVLNGLTARVQIAAEDGGAHRLDRLAVEVEKVRLDGQARIGTDAPFELAVQLNAASLASPRWQGQAQLDGRLAELALRARLTGEARAGRTPAALQASATLRPLARWPLAALRLEVDRFDLASLSAQLPETAIDGRAVVDTRGMDVPAQADVELTNHLAGRVDAGRAPLRGLTLTAAAVPSRPDEIELHRFELRLGDDRAAAGSLVGSGRWREGTLDVALELADLLPARLDARAAALSVSGPLSLQLRGLQAPEGRQARPQLSVRGRLAGRLLDGTGSPVQLDLDLDAAADHLLLRRADAQAGPARASLSGEARREGGAWRVRGKGRLERFDPLPWWPAAAGTAWQRGPHRIDARVSADLAWRGPPPAPADPASGRVAAASATATPAAALEGWLGAIDGRAELALDPSLLAGLPLSGRATLSSQGRQVVLHGSLSAGANRVALDAQVGPRPAADRWRLALQAPALQALAPLRPLVLELAPDAADGWPAAGSLEIDAEASGRWPDLRSHGRVQAQGLRSRAASVASATIDWRGGGAAMPRGDTELALKLSVQGVDAGGRRVDRLEAQVGGTLGAHRLSGTIDSPLRPPAWTGPLLGVAGTGTRLDLAAQGSWQRDAGSDRWRVHELQFSAGAREAGSDAPAWLKARGLDLELRLAADGTARALRLQPGRVELVTTALRWQRAEWAAGGEAGQLTLAAELETLDVTALLRRLQPEVGWGGDLTLAGRIDVRSGQAFDADVVLERRGGDLTVTDELGAVTRLGLSELRLALTAHDGLWQFAQGLAGSHVGEMSGAQVMRALPGARFPGAASPLQGVIDARVADLGVWGLWVPPGWRLAGTLSTRAHFGGTLGAPEFSGAMQGRSLSARNVLLGVHLSDGELDLRLDADQARIEKFTLRGGDGRLSLAGQAALGETPSARLQLQADRFLLFGRVDRRLVASGRAELNLDREAVRLEGRLDIDEGLIDISQSEAPTLDDDVRVHARGGPGQRAPGPQAAPPAPLRNAQVGLTIGLGERLRLRGRGIETGLRGQVRVSSPGGQLALHGSVRTEGGSYAAYGQKLDVARGHIVFDGVAANPSLDILAVRPNLDVVVGVAITGTAQRPRIRLVSQPEMSEMDKLSWMILGRGPDGLGRDDTALLQRAAMALLAGEGKSPSDELLGALGITDFSVRQSEGNTRDTVVTLGRQLSQRWYFGYERSLNATTGTWQLIYRIAQRLTVRAQWGEDTSLDLIRSWRWD